MAQKLCPNGKSKARGMREGAGQSLKKYPWATGDVQLGSMTEELKLFVVATEQTPGSEVKQGTKPWHWASVSKPAERGWLFRVEFECDRKEGISDSGFWIFLSLH